MNEENVEKTEKTEKKNGVDHAIDELFETLLGIMTVEMLKEMALQKIQEADTLEELVEATSYAAYTFIKKKQFSEKVKEDTETIPEG